MSVTIRGTDNSASTPAVTGTDGDTGVFFPAANQVAIATNGTQAVLVDSNQNVGVGTTSVPNYGSGFKGLQVNGSAFGFVQASAASGTSIVEIMATTGYGYVGTRTDDPLVLRTGDTARVGITRGGARQFTSQSQATYYAGDATFTLSGSNISFDLATVFPDLVGNGAGMGIMLLINQWTGSAGSGITQITLGQKSNSWTFSTVATAGSGSGSSVSGSGTVITVTAGGGYGQVRVWVTSRN